MPLPPMMANDIEDESCDPLTHQKPDRIQQCSIIDNGDINKESISHAIDVHAKELEKNP